MSVALQYDLAAIEAINRRIEQLASFDRRQLLDVVGATVESQTRRRIEKDKRGPDGTPWSQWSERYAQTRHSGHRLLEGEGSLLDSLQYAVESDSAVEIGSNLIYAATHQMGDDRRNIPARPYLGLSDDDEAELEQVVDNFMRGVMQ